MPESYNFYHGKDSQKRIEETGESLVDTENQLSDLERHLEEEYDFLKATTEQLNNLKGYNEYLDDLKKQDDEMEVTLSRGGFDKHSAEEIAKFEEHIVQINEYIEKLKAYRERLEAVRDKASEMLNRFVELEKNYQKFILEAQSPERNN